jgi:hypothetical protein
VNHLTKLLAGAIAFLAAVVANAEDVTHYQEPGLTPGREYVRCEPLDARPDGLVIT